MIKVRNTEILVGCCGFPMSRKKYYELFSTVELQDTFYNPPDVSKLTRLRKEAPNDFVFNMKAWQAVTHPPNLATWRRAKVKPPKDKWDKYGFLKPTKENLEAWDLIEKGVKALDAKAVIIQLPPSFNYSEENLKNMKEFLSIVNPKGYVIGIELRGNWINYGNKVKELLDSFKWLIHVVDPFRWRPVVNKEITYFRLHGIGGKYVNYKYKYTDVDLLKLKNIVIKYTGLIMVMFNNVYMKEDSLRFTKLLTGSQ